MLLWPLAWLKASTTFCFIVCLTSTLIYERELQHVSILLDLRKTQSWTAKNKCYMLSYSYNHSLVFYFVDISYKCLYSCCRKQQWRGNQSIIDKDAERCLARLQAVRHSLFMYWISHISIIILYHYCITYQKYPIAYIIHKDAETCLADKGGYRK